MDKLSLQIPDLTAKNVKKIEELFGPNVIVEAEDENGNLVKKVDFDLLRAELGDKSITEGLEERYRLDWPGKKRSILKANTAINKTLRPVKEDSVDWDNTQNLYIEGDNFEVLKVLQESYLGKIKTIYIDPPYNTGKDFVYNDNFTEGSEEYKERTEKNEEGYKMVKNMESNGRFHSDWLSMMYERLRIARDLLADDGVIFMSIDDNEVYNLKNISDEIFGEKCYLGTFKWNRVAKAPSLSNMMRTKYEYVLSYFKQTQPILFGKESYNTQGPLWHLPNKRNELLFPANSIRITQDFKAGMYGGTYEVELLDDIVNENGLNKNPVRIRACSARGQDRINEYVKKGNTFEIKKSPVTVYTDLDKSGNFIAPSDLISVEECNVLRNTDANEDMRKMGIPFDYTKPVSLCEYLIRVAANFAKDSIVLDFFSGSATTAHACMQLNAKDGGNRKFIMVQLPELTDENSEAYKAGYKTICEIGKERIRRAAKKIKEETGADIDYGFRVYKVDESCMKDVSQHPNEITQGDLFNDISNIREDRTPEDLLTQVMLSLGLTLDLPIEEKKIKNNRVFYVAGNSLVACFDENIDFSILEEIAKDEPLKLVFRDACFRSDADRINVENTMKRLSENTMVKVI